MHILRYEVFKQRLKWDVPTKDEFDTPEAVYIVYLDSTTLLKAFTYNGDLYATIVPHIWEASRFAIDGTTSKKTMVKGVSVVTYELLCSLTSI